MPISELRGIPAEPPIAEPKPVVTTLHGETRRDDYAWLRDKDAPGVRAYLEAENAYADACMDGTQELQDALYAEMLSRIQQTDLSVPYRRGAWLYYTRTEEGRQYAFHCRREGSMDAPEQMLIDVNALAEGLSFMAIGAYEVSPDGSKLAYSTDSTGYRQYRLRVKDLDTGALLDVDAERVTSVAWSADGRTLFYVQEDAVSKRSYRLWRHTLGTAAHTLVYEEPDERFDVYVSLTRSGEWLVQTRASHTTSEVCVLDAATPDGAWTLLAPRVQDREYFVEHRGGEFYIRVNDTGRNFRIVTAPVASPSPEHWTELVAHRPEVMITGIDCFAGHLVWTERERALPHIVVMDLATRAAKRVTFDEAAYAVGPGANEEFAATTFRYGYQSFLTPPSVYDLDLGTLRSTMRKRTEVLGGWNPDSYVLERIEAVTADGVRVPLTLLARRDTPRDGSAPCLLYAYGSYGMPSNVLFNPNRFCLVDRGMVYALAHIRGGGDLGKAWHDDGRMAKKMNTFTDFVACAEHLCATKWTSPEGLVAQGGSAGGLLMGAVTNLRPDLFRGVLSQVPFVDCINTMLDESLPLTVGEFEEWGNPKLAEQYEWMRAYSPYDNLEEKAYPAILVKTSLNDSQVGYWEPAKYVAKLRTKKTDARPLLFKCNMGAGHGGASGRYDALREIAFDYAWILNQVGLAGTKPRH
ncbi:MAG: S9 family peptidase [Candidatus Eisenbacteria bacterium]|uniref:S9 family peptidase n=1 Tax=Eiseniibacteriota bacterium TaxID=2212470 RepID=A0A933SE63_UNCEI|nr:S9 family peptidase [Candidatus Eisenbacteria bacterium]